MQSLTRAQTSPRKQTWETAKVAIILMNQHALETSEECDL